MILAKSQTLAVLGIALLTFACGRTADGPERRELVVAIESAPIHLDPRVGTDQASSRVFEVMLNGLATKDPQGNLVPDLAEKWEIFDEGLVYRFHLRPGVRFHDGSALDAQDVVWTFRTMLDGTVRTPKRGAFPQLAAVEAVDPLTVDFEMKEPFGAMLVNLTSYMGIIPSGSLPESFTDSPVGTGPYRLVARTPERLELEAFPEHFGGPPGIPRLIIRAVPDQTVRALELRKGSTHLVVNGLAPDVVEKFRGDPAFRVETTPGSNFVYLGLNLDDPILSIAAVREALARAIDRQRLVDTLWRGLGVVTATPIPEGHWGRDPELEPLPYDPEGARRLLDQAGLPDPDGPGPEPRFELVYKTSTDETALLQAQIVQAMLAEVGIDVGIRSYEFATFYNDVKRGNFQVFSLTATGIVDPDWLSLFLHSKRIPPAGNNRVRYRNPDFDRLLDLGARAVSPQERRPHYLEAQRIFARDLPLIGLLTKVNVAVMPTRLQGYRNYLAGELYGVKDLTWGE